MKIPSLFLGLALALGLYAPARAAVYFVAHQDDMVLMMGRSAQTDIRSNVSTVIVTLTAGDAGNGRAALTMAGIAGRYYNQMGNPYFRVRHNAQEAAVATWVPAVHSRMVQRSTEYFGPDMPAVEKARIGNVTMYNLNLPDAWLQRFYAGAIPVLPDVAGINRYTPALLRETLRQIVSRNHRNLPTVVVNLPEHTPAHSEAGYNDRGEVATNPDHIDHTATGRLVRDALAEQPAYACAWQVVYMGYAIRTMPDTMSGLEKLAQIQAFMALDTVLRNQGNVSYFYDLRAIRLGTMDAFHMSFYGKQRWRNGGGGAPACTF